VTEGEGGLGYFPARLRRTLQNRVGELFPEDSVPFLQALLLGESSGLDYATETALSLSGLRHVAAVSGLHLSILFSVVFFFTRRNRYLSLLVGAPVLLIFSAMVGFTPSILRSALMQLLMLGALALDREYDPPTALGFAALIMIAGNPLTVTAVGFQLSVASVAGILLVAERLRSWLMDPKRLGRWKFGTLRSKIASWFSVVVSVTLGALLFNTPLTAWYFGSVSLLCVLTNLLCLWAVTLLFCGSLAVLALGTIWLPLGKCLGWCLGWVVRYVLTVAGLIAKFPLSSVYTQSPYVVLWLVFVYGRRPDHWWNGRY
jgi:competence protein ComEC